MVGRVDLHTHTRRSDGILEPTALRAAMTAAGMRVVSITDHDTLAGVRELVASPQLDGPVIVPGLEINTVGDDIEAWRGLGRDDTELHVLGYGVPLDDPDLEATLARQRALRRERVERLLERVAAAGMRVELGPGQRADANGASLGRPHVARALVRSAYASSIEDAFARYLGPGGSCYVPREGIGARAAIELIRSTGGIAVLAHAPHAPDEPAVVDELIAAGLQGLEVHYRSFDPPTIARMAALAAARGLLATGGSDFHGDGVDYATATATLQVPEEVGDRLLHAHGGRG
jgi:predicted metal-dependent phosphoesterase TrpH